MTQISTPGVYDLPAEVYHADPCVEPSLMKSTPKFSPKPPRVTRPTPPQNSRPYRGSYRREIPRRVRRKGTVGMTSGKDRNPAPGG